MFCQSHHSPELKELLAAELDLVLQTSDSAYDKVNIPGPGTQCWFAFIFYFFSKDVLGIWRHNPGDFECLIPQIIF